MEIHLEVEMSDVYHHFSLAENKKDKIRTRQSRVHFLQLKEDRFPTGSAKLYVLRILKFDRNDSMRDELKRSKRIPK